jgi:steroid 5-alpha reductase family enzyme
VSEPPTEPAVGIWRAFGTLGNVPAKRLLWPEGLPALIIGIGGAVLIVRASGLPGRIAVMPVLLGLAGAILAVVFVALALVVSIPSPRYIRMLGETEGGAQAFLSPFLVAVGTQITIVFLALGYMLAAARVPRVVEHLVFYGIGLIVVFGLLDVAALARSLVRHGINRSITAAQEGDESESGRADVHQLRRDTRPS